jgi:hypothetical protein
VLLCEPVHRCAIFGVRARAGISVSFGARSAITCCHPRESGDPGPNWVLAFARMTSEGVALPSINAVVFSQALRTRSSRRIGCRREYRNSGQRLQSAAANILIKTPHRAGRAVTRERLADASEILQNFHTDLAPPVGFSATRRVAADGAWIVPLGGGQPNWWNRCAIPHGLRSLSTRCRSCAKLSSGARLSAFFHNPVRKLAM